MFSELKASYQPLDRPKIHGFTLNIDCFLNGRNFDFVDQRVINRILSTLTLNRPVILSTSLDIEDLESVITQRLEDLLTYRNGSYLAKNLFAICQNGSAIYSFKFDTVQKILTPLIDEQIHTDASSALRFIAINFLGNTNLDSIARFEPESQEPQNETKILKHSLDFEVKDCNEVAEKLGNYNISPNVVLPRETFLDARNTWTLQELYSQTAQESRVRFRKGLDLLKDEATQTFQIGRPEFLDTIRFSLDGGIEYYFEELNLSEESAFYCFVNQVSYLNRNKRRYFLNYGSEKSNHKHWYSRAEGYYLTESKAVGDLPTIKKYKWLAESAIDLLRMVSKIQGLFVENHNLNHRDWKLGLSFYDNLRTQLLHIFHSYSYLKTLGLSTSRFLQQ